MEKDEIIEGLIKIIDAYGDNEGYIPSHVTHLYNKYYKGWKTIKIKEALTKLDQTISEADKTYKKYRREYSDSDLLKDLQAIHGKEEGLKQYKQIMEMEKKEEE